MSVRKVLENFIEHVKKLEAAEESGARGNFSKEFQALKKKSGNYLRDGTYPATEGEKEQNKSKNRYKDILPFDYTRVVLEPVDGEEGSDYINANFLKGINDSRAYIASQGPLPGTVNDFWRMVWQYNVRIIVMASNEYEAGKHKCQRYWPTDDEEKHFMDIRVTLLSEENHGEFLVRRISAQKGAGSGAAESGSPGKQSSNSRCILQFHYTSWPDHGIPSSTRPMLDMIALVREHQPGHDPPIVVHCSAGCGRTGTICAIDYSWNLLKMGKLTSRFSLYKIIAEMRKQRPSIVQAKDQYVIAHKAVSELFERHLEVMNHHFYENVDEKGQPRSPGGESPSSESGQIPPDSSYEDLASPIVRIELAPPVKLLQRRSMLVEATSPTHKAVQSTVAQIIKSESDNDLKAGTSSQLKCATPTLHSKFSFDEKDIEQTVPPSPTRITLTGPGSQDDGDVLLADGPGLRSEALTSSSHSAESGYSSYTGGGGGGGGVTGAPSHDELELSGVMNRTHISGGRAAEAASQPSQQQHDRTSRTKQASSGVNRAPRQLLLRDRGATAQTDTSQTRIQLPGSHTRDTCTDVVLHSQSEDVVQFEDNPVYEPTSVAKDNKPQPRSVPTHRDKTSPPSTPPKPPNVTSPSRIKGIVSELNKQAISEDSAQHNSNSRNSPIHSKVKQSPVKTVPKPSWTAGSRQGFVKGSETDEGEYGDVEGIPRIRDSESDNEYSYATADSVFQSGLMQLSDSGYCYVDPKAPPRDVLQATAQRIMEASSSGSSTGAKPKTTLHGRGDPSRVPAKPPRKSKPASSSSSNVFNQGPGSPDGAYEPVAVPKSASNGSSGGDATGAQGPHHGGGSSASSGDEMYAPVDLRPPVRSTSQESFESDDDSGDDGAPRVPPKTERSYQSSSEESLQNPMPDMPDDLLKSTAGAVRTLGRVFKKRVQQAFGANTWPLPSDRELSVHGPVTFKNRDVSYGRRVAPPRGPRNTSNFAPMPAPSKFK